MGSGAWGEGREGGVEPAAASLARVPIPASAPAAAFTVVVQTVLLLLVNRRTDTVPHDAHCHTCSQCLHDSLIPASRAFAASAVVETAAAIEYGVNATWLSEQQVRRARAYTRALRCVC